MRALNAESILGDLDVTKGTYDTLTVLEGQLALPANRAEKPEGVRAV
jgi:hypothetical protein